MNTATIRSSFNRLGWAILAFAAAVLAILLLQSSPSWAQATTGSSGNSGSTGAAIASGTRFRRASVFQVWRNSRALAHVHQSWSVNADHTR